LACARPRVDHAGLGWLLPRDLLRHTRGYVGAFLKRSGHRQRV
jgi:hypothetical protein